MNYLIIYNIYILVLFDLINIRKQKRNYEINFNEIILNYILTYFYMFFIFYLIFYFLYLI